jgi:asparagine synthetase B (glutamine-hydrolysing)
MSAHLSIQQLCFTRLQAKTRKLYFGRDPLGRRSLLISRPVSQAPWLVLASVSVGQSPHYSLDELPTGNLFYLDLDILESVDVSARHFGRFMSLTPLS